MKVFLKNHYTHKLECAPKYHFMPKSEVHPKIVSEYDQEIPQSQTADNPMAP